MSNIAKGTPVRGERLVLMQPAALDSLDLIKAAQADLSRAIRDALKSGALVLDRNAVVLREFSDGTDAVLFVVGAGLIVGRLADSAEAKRAYAASTSTTTTRPGLYR